MNDNNLLIRLLAERDVLLADGATGTNLFDMGLQSGDAPELWNIDHPQRIESLHQNFVMPDLIYSSPIPLAAPATV